MYEWKRDGDTYVATGAYPDRVAVIRPEARGYGWEVTQDGVAIAASSASIRNEEDPTLIDLPASLAAAKAACIEHLEREHGAA